MILGLLLWLLAPMVSTVLAQVGHTLVYSGERTPQTIALGSLTSSNWTLLLASCCQKTQVSVVARPPGFHSWGCLTGTRHFDPRLNCSSLFARPLPQAGPLAVSRRRAPHFCPIHRFLDEFCSVNSGSRPLSLHYRFPVCYSRLACSMMSHGFCWAAILANSCQFAVHFARELENFNLLMESFDRLLGDLLLKQLIPNLAVRLFVIILHLLECSEDMKAGLDLEFGTIFALESSR